MSKKKEKLKTLGDIEKHIQDHPELMAYGKLVAFTAKSIAWYNSFDEKEIVFMKYAEFRFSEGLTVPEAFDELKKDLVRRGKEPEMYGLKDDPDNFNRSFTKSKFVLNNNYIKHLKDDPDSFKMSVKLKNK